MQKSIRQIVRVKKVKGEIGVEIEMEGTGLHFRGDEVWRREHDPSLKAAESAEFVLCKPLSRVKAKQAVASLYRTLKGAKIDDSIRAGVHIHVNVQNLTPTQLATSLTVYYLLEKVLTDYCGEGRAGNLFCLRLCDAEHPLFYLNKVYGSKRFEAFNVDDIRYAACNLKALAQYGSLEFRALKTSSRPIKVNRWIDMLYRVVLEVHDKYETPVQVLTRLSEVGSHQFLEEVLGENLVKHLNLENLEDKVRDMVDIVQVFVFSHDWNDKVAPNLNIFGTQPEEDW